MKKIIIIITATLSIAIAVVTGVIIFLQQTNDNLPNQNNDKKYENNLNIYAQAPTIDNEYLLENDVVTINFESKGKINNVFINNKLYILTNNQVELIASGDELFVIEISKITIEEIDYNISKVFTYKIISKDQLKNIAIKTNTGPTFIEINALNYNYEFPLYMSITGLGLNYNNLYQENNLIFKDLYINSVYQTDLYLLRDNGESISVKSLDINTTNPINIVSTYNDDNYSYDLDIDVLENCEVQSYSFAGKTYDFTSNSINIAKPPGEEYYYEIIFYGKCQDSAFTYQHTLYFRPTSSEGELSLNVREINGNFTIYAYTNFDPYLALDYRIEVYLDDELVAFNEDVNALDFREYYFSRQYKAVAYISYLDYITLEKVYLEKSVYFDTPNYYPDDYSPILFLPNSYTIEIHNNDPENVEILSIELYDNDNLVKTYYDTIITDIRPGDYKFRVNYQLDMHDNLSKKLFYKDFYYGISYKSPALNINFNVINNSVEYLITNSEKDSLINNFTVKLYENNNLVATSNNFQDSFTQLDYQCTYNIIVDYDFYTYELVTDQIFTGDFQVLKGLDEPSFNYNFDSTTSTITISPSLEYDFDVKLENVECALFDFKVTTVVDKNKIIISDWPIDELGRFTYTFDISINYYYNNKLKTINKSLYIGYQEGEWYLV